MKANVIAYHLVKSFEINDLKHKINFTLLKREPSFLLYEIKKDAYVYIKSYGSVVFYNCEEELIKKIFKVLIENDYDFEDFYHEAYQLVKGKKLEIDFNTIFLPEFDIDVLHIIMLNLGQSVALQEYTYKTSELHESTLVYTKQLEKNGNISLSKTRMRKFIGRTLNLKNTITEELFIFDTPDLAWTNEQLSKLDEQLKEELSIEKRFKGLQLSLDTIKENLDLFNDIHQHRYSSMLEWIIIILILIEVVQIFI